MAEPSKNDKGLNVEKPAALNQESEAGKIDKKKVRETSVTVGVEAGGIVEGLESQGSGEIQEKESKNKDKDSGNAISQTQAQTKAATITGTLPKLPSVEQMTTQVKKELKLEIKDLNRKIKKVMKSRNIDAHKLNSLVAKLRNFKSLLSKLASATADIIKDMWITHVKENKTKA